MNRLIELAAMLLGGLSLFAVAFVGFTVVSGTPMSEVPMVGSFFEPPQLETAPDDGEEEKERQERLAERTDKEVIQASMGVLDVWSLPSPYTRTELQTLTDELKARMHRLDLQETELAEREARVQEQLDVVAERFETIESLRAQLDSYRDELELRAQEVERVESDADARREARWQRVAGVIANLDDEVAGARLSSYSPEDAAMILTAMDDGRAADLLNQLQGERWKEYVDAYTRLAVD